MTSLDTRAARPVRQPSPRLSPGPLGAAGLRLAGRRVARPRIYVHMGEPKTGTTFLQDVLWANRTLLATRGVLLPGHDRADHWRASRDLREARLDRTDPADPVTGEWDVLAAEALRAPHLAVISDEVLAACRPSQAERALRSLAGAEVHLIVTLRDFCSLLPAEWQETVKCRGTLAWERWLADVIDSGPAADRRGRSMFWTLHDTLANLGMWSRGIPPDRAHILTVPRRGGRALLWERFAAVLGIDPSGVDVSQARANSSLGITEVEFLRRVNEALPPDVPYWFYARHVKRVVAEGVLADRPRHDRLVVPADLHSWASDQSEHLISGLRARGYHVVGDLEELLPEPGGRGYVAPAVDSVALPAETAALAVAALAGEQYRQMYPQRAAQASRQPSLRERARMLTSRALNGWRVSRLLRRFSHRAAVRRIRIAIWCLLVRPARHLPPVRPQSASG